MKAFYASVLAMLIALPVYAQDAKTEVPKANQEYVAAYNSGDMKKFGEGFAEDAKSYPPGSGVKAGREAILKEWESYKSHWSRMKLETVEVIEAGPDLAIETGNYSGMWQGKPDKGKYLTVWKKEGDTWKVYRDIWNSNAPQ
jgi:uncharacterized protein (TIGR02246 family)